jgi:hypothetical protein
VSDVTAGTDDQDHDQPKIDVSNAIGEGGHEVRDLGYEGVPDSGPVTHPEETERDLDAELDATTGEAALD